jgi:Tfp pilus assembly protein PilF
MSLKVSLKAAKEELAKKDYKAALQHCKGALKIDKNSYEAYL